MVLQMNVQQHFKSLVIFKIKTSLCYCNYCYGYCLHRKLLSACFARIIIGDRATADDKLNLALMRVQVWRGFTFLAVVGTHLRTLYNTNKSLNVENTRKIQSSM